MSLSSLWPRLQVPAAATVLMFTGWFVSGHLAVFTDTMAYVRQGEFWASYLHLAAPLGDPPAQGEHMSLMPSALAKYGPLSTTVAAARSPFYGLFLYIVGGFGTLWAVVLLQALTAAWLLRVVTRWTLPDHADRAYWGLIVFLAAGSSLPFFVDFAMPDLFGGLGYLAGILLIVATDRLSRFDRICLWMLVSVACVFHQANAPVIVCVAIIGWALLGRVRGSRREIAKRALVVLSAPIIAVLATATAHDAFRRDTGYVLGNPPFLMSRVLLDGPGKEYLDATCPSGVSSALCSLKDRPMTQEDDVLWRPVGGVFGSADYAMRRRLQKDEMPFVMASIKFDPWLTGKAALTNWMLQAAMVFVDDPLGNPGKYLAHPNTDGAALKHLEPTLQPCATADACYRIPIRQLRWDLMALHVSIVILSLIAMGWCGFVSVRRLETSRQDGADTHHLRMVLNAGGLILAGVMINAAVFGILSGPYARYQARIIWLVPMAAILGVLTVRRDAARLESTARLRRERADEMKPARENEVERPGIERHVT